MSAPQSSLLPSDSYHSKLVSLGRAELNTLFLSESAQLATLQKEERHSESNSTQVAMLQHNKTLLLALLSPDDPLPDSIMTDIFVLYNAVEDIDRPRPRHATYRLGKEVVPTSQEIVDQVCADWGRLALGIVRRWTCINLDIQRHGPFTFTSVFTKWLECSLDLSVCLWVTVSSEEVASELGSIIIPRLHRFHTLDIQIPASLLAHLIRLPPPSLPDLEEVKLICDTSYASNLARHRALFKDLRTTSLFMHAPKLRALRCEGLISGTKQNGWFGELRLPCTQLTCLEIGPLMIKTPAELWDVLRRFPNLVHLFIDLPALHRPNSFTIPQNLSLPSSRLESLTLRVRRTGYQVLEGVRAPRLKKLNISMYHWGVTREKGPQPLGRTLRRFHSISGRFPCLETFRIAYSESLCEDDLLKIFASTPTLQSVDISECTKIRAGTIMRALQGKKDSGDAEHLLPELSVFYLDCRFPERLVKDGCVPDMLESRWEAAAIGEVARLTEVKLKLGGCLTRDSTRRVEALRDNGLNVVVG
ncbi:hypothetical protein BDP27DRAFT_207335 [Rhodocollybia butyracea]|uniref:F-box domain-containing protein n=1 Tax=Rhodocollybia butyracea TaxID=206335 RepID=A0A9P5PEV1_9AGAR|nr:hypothetical protein BDP27DRAFT_207335 [Rhodocollybia butyracea]